MISIVACTLGSVQLPPSSSSGPVPSYVTIFKTKTKTEHDHKTITVTETIPSCSTPGSPDPGKPTSIADPDDKPASTPKPLPQSTPTLFSSTGPPASPASSPAPSPSPTYVPSGDDDDDDNCEGDGDDDDASSSLPVNSSLKPNPSSPGYSSGFHTPPASLIFLSSSPAVPPIPSNTDPSSVVPSPASSVISSTGTPKPTSTGKYDRNAICGGQKREPSPFEATPHLVKRDFRRRIVY